MRRFVAGSGIAILLVVGISSHVEALVLCINPLGFISARERCLFGSREVDPAELGLVGPAGVSGWELIRGDGTVVEPDVVDGEIVNCPEGKKPVGGGFNVGGLPGPWTVLESAPRIDPDQDQNGWAAFIRNDGPADVKIFAHVICAIAN